MCAGLLEELAYSGTENILSSFDLALLDRPRALVLVGPEGAARVPDEDLEVGASVTVEQDSGAIGHGRTILSRHDPVAGRVRFSRRVAPSASPSS